MKYDNLEKMIAEAGRRLEVQWSAARRDAVLERLHRRRRNRVMAGAVAAVAVCLVAVAASTAVLFQHRVQPRVVSVKHEGVSEVRLADGSKVDLLSKKSRMDAQFEEKTGRVRILLSSGRARFDVVHNPARKFRVEAGPVTIHVVGTRFVVERLERQVRISVESGRVRIERIDSVLELGAGDTAAFPDQIPEGGAPSGPPSESRKEGQAAAAPEGSPSGPGMGPDVRTVSRLDAAVRTPAAAETWKSFAMEGGFEKAYELLKDLPERELPDDPGDLLLMADVARLTAHPGDATAPLKRLIDVHTDDPRAPLAAFTLGRVMLDDLGDPRGAADAFFRARSLAPTGPMAEDALAREVEAHWRSGDTARARELAGEYIAKYPKGRRLGSVRHYGGAE